VRLGCAIAALAAASLLAAPAAAHGPPPAVTRVIAVDADGPRVVATTEGLAMRRGAGFRYLCPVLFGDELEPPAAAADGEAVYVAGTRDLYVVDPEGRVTALERPELSRSTVLRLVASGGRVLALRLEGGVTDLRPLDGSPSIWSDPAIYDSITPQEPTLWLARSAGATGHVLQLGSDGSRLRTLDVPIDLGERISQVRSLGETLYLTLVESSGGRVVALPAGDAGAAEVLSGRSQISGPLSSGASTWMAADGVLYDCDLGGGEVLPRSTSEPVTAVLGVFTQTFATVRTSLLDLDDSGPGALRLDMAYLEPPDLALVPEGLRETCESEWLVLRADLEWVGAIPAPPVAEAGAGRPSTELHASRAGGGCSVGGRLPTAAGSAVLWLLVGALLARRPTR